MLLCVANTLTEGDWATRAEAQREEIVKLAEGIRRDKLMLAAVRAAQHLVEAVIEDKTDEENSTHD